MTLWWSKRKEEKATEVKELWHGNFTRSELSLGWKGYDEQNKRCWKVRRRWHPRAFGAGLENTRRPWGFRNMFDFVRRERDNCCETMQSENVVRSCEPSRWEGQHEIHTFLCVQEVIYSRGTTEHKLHVTCLSSATQQLSRRSEKPVNDLTCLLSRT